ILAIDGQIWKKAMGEHKIDWVANEGIRARAIVAHLRGLSDLSDAQKALVHAVVNLPGGESSPAQPVRGPGPAGGPHAAATTLTVGQPSGPARVAGPAAVFGAQAQWLIPLQVAISLGTPALVAGAAAAAPHGDLGAAPP